MAIAWMYREDYARAGYLVLPYGRARGSFVALQTILPLVALVRLSLLPALAGQPSIFYFTGGLLPSLGFSFYGVQFVLPRSHAAARRLWLASIIYLPSLLALIVLLRGWRAL